MKHLNLLCLLLLMATLSIAQTSKIEQLILQGNSEQAIPLLQKEIAKDSTNGEFYFTLARAYQNINKNNSAVVYYRKALKLMPENTMILLNLATCLYAQGDYKNTILHLQEYNKMSNNNYKSNLLLAKTQNTLGNYGRAIKIYQQLIAKDSTDSVLHKLLGKVKYRKQDFMGAINSYLKSYKLNRNNLSVLVYLAQSFYEIGAYEQALQFLNDGLLLYPRNSILLKKKAKCLMGLKWFENALEIFENRRENKQLNANGYKMLGICYMQTKDYNKAIEAFNNCGKTFDNDAMLNYYKGYCYLQINNFQQAIKYLNDAILYITSPSKASMHLQLAKAYGMHREFAKSVAQYKKSYDLDSSNYKLLYEIATTYEEFGKNRNNALRYYKKYIKQCTNKKSKRYEYAKSRVLHIKEDIHWEK